LSDYIDTQNEIFEEIQKLYNISQKNLVSAKDDLEIKFDELIKLHSRKYNLVENKDFNVNPTQYYHLKARVKTLHSFKEKLYRKNLGLQISNKHKLSLGNFSRNRAKIKKSIFLLDDIIGLRIVTELTHDCKYAYELVKNENQTFIDSGIVFNIDELGNQPETMKNGLPIFRIKGVYKEQYGFELQIKSKIDEAWGDMDHSLFYKDYSVSPIKNTVQVTMNNVGHLFSKIEDLLLGLRNSENSYKEKKDEIDFLYELSGNVFNAIKNKLGDNYDLSNIASSIKFIKIASKVKNENSEVKKLNFEFLNYVAIASQNKNYVKTRDLNFELIILETLYWHWKKKANKNFRLNAISYDKNLKYFIEILLENLSINVNTISKLNFLDINKDKISKFIIDFSNVELVKPLYLDVKTTYELLIIDTLVGDAINEIFEDGSLDDDLVAVLKNIYLYNHLGKEIAQLIEGVRIQYHDFIDLNDLNDSVFKINVKIEEQLNLYKVDENYLQLKEVKFLSKLVTKVIRSVKNLNLAE